MRLKPALILLAAFVLVIGALAVFVSTYEGPATDELEVDRPQAVFPDLSPELIARVEILSPKTGGKAVVLERIAGRKWRLVRPFRAVAAAGKVEALLQDLVALEATGYPTRSFVEYELDRPLYRVTVTTVTGDRVTLAFGTETAGVDEAGAEETVDLFTLEAIGGTRKSEPHRYARLGRRNQVLIVKDVICPQINVAPASLRDDRLLFAETDDAFVPVELKSVTGVTVTVRTARGQARSMRFARGHGGAWRLTAPVAARADDRRVDSVLKHLLRLRASADKAYVEEEPKDLAKYGLDKPSVVVELRVDKGPDGKPARHILRFGRSPADQPGLVYAQSSARPAVLLVGNGVVNTTLRQDAVLFRDRHLVTLGPKDVRAVTIRYAGRRPTLTLERRADDPNRWRITEPVSGRAGSAQADNLVYRVTGLTVEPNGFVAENPRDLAKYGLDKPRLTVVVQPKAEGTPPVTVHFGRSPADHDDLVYARNAAEPSVVLVMRSVLETFSPPVRQLRDETLLDGYESWDADELEIRSGGRIVRLRKKGRMSWAFVQPKGVEVDYSAPNDFLDDVGKLKILAWPADRPADYAKFGLTKPRAILTIRTTRRSAGDEFAEDEQQTGAESRTFTLLFGNTTPDGRRCYVRVRRPDEPNVYEIKADLLRQIDKGVLEFRDRGVLRFDARNVREIRVEGGRTDYRAVRVPGGEWLLQRPFVGTGHRSNIEDLLDTLGRLDARELVCEGGLDDPKYGLAPGKAKPYRTVAIVIEEKKPVETAKAADAPKGGAKKKKKESGRRAKTRTVRVSLTLLVGSRVPGNQDGDRYAVVAEEKIVFVMSATDVQKLDEEFASLEILDVPRGDVASVSVTHRNGSGVEVARKDGRWRISSHTGVRPDRKKIEAFVDAAGSITAERYVAYDVKNRAKYGLRKPLLTVRVTPRAKVPLTLFVGDAAPPARGEKGEQKKAYYATGAGVRAVFLLKAETVRALDKHVEDLIQKKAKK